MKLKLASLLKISILIMGTVLTTLFFKLHLGFAFVIVFTSLNLLEELIEYIIDINYIKRYYSDVLATPIVRYRIRLTLYNTLTLFTTAIIILIVLLPFVILL